LFASAAASSSPEGFSSPKFLAVSFISSVALSKIQKRKRNKHDKNKIVLNRNHVVEGCQ